MPSNDFLNIAERLNAKDNVLVGSVKTLRLGMENVLAGYKKSRDAAYSLEYFEHHDFLKRPIAVKSKASYSKTADKLASEAKHNLEWPEPVLEKKPVKKRKRG